MSHRQRLVALVLLALGFAPLIYAKGWQGYTTSLKDAQIACSDIHSDACEPFLAAAVGFTAALTDTAKFNIRDNTYTVTFGGGVQETCTTRWHESMNGLQLVQLTVAGARDYSSGGVWYFLDAMMATSRERCHIE